jgi:TonB family protein
MNDNGATLNFDLSTERRPTGVRAHFGLKRSLAGHALLFLAAFAKSFVFPGNTSPYIPVLKVDLVELPDILKKDLAVTAQNQLSKDISKILKQAEQDAKRLKAKVPQVAEKDEMVVKPKSSSEKSIQKKNRRAMDRIKALAKIQDSTSADLQISKKDLKLLIVKGNKLSPGTSLSADAKEASQANYLDSLRDLLRQNWFLPAWIAKQNLGAQVLIRIDSAGILREFRLVKSSQNTQFDEAVKQAIQQSQPFPPPPPELKTGILSDGILVGFPL